MEDQAFFQQIQDKVQALTDLAKRLKIRSPAKLLAAARGKIPATLQLAKAALEFETGKQVLAPRYRSTGKSAAEGPNERLQVDLIDFSLNTKTKQKYALMVQDVYTREVRAQPLPNKTPAVVNEAAQELIPKLVEGKQNYTVTSDKGREFSALEQAIPEQAVHRMKQGKNDIAVIDRAMQSVKKDMAGDVANGDASNWVEALPGAVEAHNSRPHSAVFGPPESVEKNGVQDFKVLQDNARKFSFNRNAQQRKRKAVQEAGSFRAPTRNTRSFEPQYGDVQVLGSRRRDDPPDLVRNQGRGEFLLKEILPVQRGSVNAAGRLTDPAFARQNRLQPDADNLEAHLIESGGSMRVAELEKQIRQNVVLPSLKRTLTKARMTLRSFLRVYPEMFRLAWGIVSVINTPPAAAPQPPETAPETAEERRARMDRQFEASQRLREEQDRAREQRQKERQQQRLGGVRAAFGVRPVG